jgi:CheY-like chemotaxis protein
VNKFRRFATGLWMAVLPLVALFISPRSSTAQEAAATAPDEAVESPLPQEPETPAQLFDAILLTLRLDRPEIALRYLDTLLKLEPDDATLLAIREKHGTGTFLELSRIEALQPQAEELLQRVTGAALRRINDSAFVDGVISDLAGAPRQRMEALNELRHLGTVAVPPLLQRLAAPTAQTDRGLLLNTLVQLGEPAVAPLLGAVRVPQEELRSDVIELLGYLGSEDEVVPHLWYPAYAEGQPTGVQSAAKRALARQLYGSPDAVARLPAAGISDRLRKVARQHLRGAASWKIDDNGLVGLWTWDGAAGTVVEHRVSPRSASLFIGQELAREALTLSPQDADGQTLFLTLALSSDIHRNGWDKPIPEGSGTAHDLALTAGADVTERVLKLALEEKSPAAAVAALHVLGQNGSRHLLQYKGRSAPVLIAALDAPDERVQFAAASAIMQLDPDAPFRGARRIVEIFARALGGSDQPRTVVVDPNVERATFVADLLSRLGYNAGIATTGMDGFLMAAEQGTIDLAVLHLNTIQWELSQTIENLRADSRTANVPIAIYGPRGLQSSVQRLIDRNQPVVYLEEANDTRDVSQTLRPFLAQVTPPALTSDQRAEQMAAAAYWLTHIAQGQRTKIFDLKTAETSLANTISNPDLARDALIALGAIGTPTAQQTLADAALGPGFELPVRETAALQLAFHIQRFGGLLTNEQLDSIQNTWEATTEPEMKTALASVIGSLQPTAEAISRQLQSFPGAEKPAE